jgi:phage baseplate assembly protein W
MEKIDRSFLGTGWGFPPTFTREGYRLKMLSNEEDVHSSIGIILHTLSGERVMLPGFGCNMRPYLFEGLTPSNIALMEKIIKDALVYHEPRIIVETFESVPDINNGMLTIKIGYTIITTNTRYNYVFPFYIKEATNIDT